MYRNVFLCTLLFLEQIHRQHPTREGIFWYNTDIIKNCKKPTHVPTEKFLSERKSSNSDNIRFCSDCKRFLSGSNFWKHRKTRTGEEAEPVNHVHKDPEFVTNILNKFRTSEAGHMCMTNTLIQQVGYRHYCLRRCHTSKPDELRTNVVQEMRELARLLIQFKSTANEHGLDGTSLGVEDMFTRRHLAVLREAIDILADGGKYGLKLNLNAIVIRTMKSLKGLYAEKMEDAKCKELYMFADAYRFRSHEMFATARYQVVHQSMDKDRRPASLPEETSVETLKTYLNMSIKRLSSQKELVGEDYVLLRSLVVCRLTLFNGRRAEEPSRMLVSEWEDAKNGEWLQKHEFAKQNTGRVCVH